MQKMVLWIVVAGAAVAVLYFATRPEPTPADRVSAAVEQAGQAAQDAAEEIGDAATEAANALQQEVEDNAAELQDQAATAADAVASQISQTSQEAKDRLTALMQIWRDTGIVTESGIDFDAAISAVEQTDMGTDARMQLVRVLEFIRNAPGDAKTKLAAIDKALQN